MAKNKNKYGRFELKKKYRKYFSYAFYISVCLHMLFLALFALLYQEDPETKKPISVRITLPKAEVQIPAEKLFISSSSSVQVSKEPQTTGMQIKTTPSTNSSNDGSSNKNGDGTPNKGLPLRSGSSLDDGNFGNTDSKMDVSGNKGEVGTPGTPYAGKKDQGWGQQGGKNTNYSSALGDKDGSKKGIPQSGDATGTPGNDPSNRPGGQVGKGITNFSVNWSGGGTRNRVAGALPKSPGQLSKSVQIKLSITVLPNGTISKVVPLQKGDFNLESETIKTIKTWKFEPLKSSSSQVEQTAVVTFLFTLE